VLFVAQALGLQWLLVMVQVLNLLLLNCHLDLVLALFAPLIFIIILLEPQK
jgi:hypothetical protein